VVEALVERRRRNSLPSRRRVARLASLLEAAVVNVGVAIRALRKGDSCISRLAVSARRVALLTSDLGVQSAQRVAGFGVIKLLDRGYTFPVGEIVALVAIRAQPPLVRVLVAGGARLGDAEEGFVQILYFEERAIGGGYVLGAVTLVAVQACVLCLERIPRLLVVERIRIPLNDGKIFSVVVGVAAHASLAGARLLVVSGVEPTVRSEASRDFGMAFQTLECRLAGGKSMACRTVCRAVKRLVGAR